MSKVKGHKEAASDATTIVKRVLQDAWKFKENESTLRLQMGWRVDDTSPSAATGLIIYHY